MVGYHIKIGVVIIWKVVQKVRVAASQSYVMAAPLMVEMETAGVTAEMFVRVIAKVLLQVTAEVLIQVTAEVLVQVTAEVFVQVTAGVLVQVTAEVFVQVTAEMLVQVTAEVLVQVTAEVLVQVTAEVLVQVALLGTQAKSGTALVVSANMVGAWKETLLVQLAKG